MFQKMLASMGVGAAKIDLILDKQVIMMGQEVQGKIVLRGGKSTQEIDALQVELKLTSSYRNGDTTVPVKETISKVNIFNQKMTVQPGQELEFPFHFICPERLPISSFATRYYFETDLDIDRGLDAKDRDYIQVHPSGLLHNFLAGFQQLGLEPYAEGYTGRHRGIQIIQFRPTQWLRGEFDEIVFSFIPRQAQTQINGWFELDKANRGLTGLLADQLDLDERKGRFSFSHADLSSEQRAAATIRNFIIQNSQGLTSG